MGVVLNKIIILDESLINKIAAGEVIERPASIVKELIENAIDAKTKHIFIDVKEGGKSYIKVSDNGQGMSKKDAELSWHRHSTSKIKTVDDLFAINSLGFRGEALGSIAAISELSIITKPENEVKGIKITVKAGKKISKEVIGCPQGTTIEVKNLFFNTPARKKYLKSMEVELRHIIDIVTRYALIHPEIHFKLYHHSKEILNAPFANEFINLSYVYGNISKEFLRIESQNKFIITGFISKPSISKSTKNDQSIYVNKRYIKNSTISTAINDAYKTLMMVKRFPVVILNIEIPSKYTDVNVHPQKSEIRIQNEQHLYQEVFEAVRTTLQKNDLIPQTLSPGIKKIVDFAPASRKHYTIEPKQKLLVRESDGSKLPGMNILGVVNKTYILAEIPGHLLLIDQHAAAERIIYEKFMEQLKNKKVNVQELLNQYILEVTPKQFNTAISNQEFLHELGYFFEEFGKNTLIVKKIPVVLGKQFDKNLFLDFVDELEKSKKPVTLDMFFHNKIASIACRTAIKAGDNITEPQIKNTYKSYWKKIFLILALMDVLL